MGGPYRATNLKITITANSVDYVLQGIQNLDTNFKYEGGAEPYYGHRQPKHSAGSKAIGFSLQRMFYTDLGYEDLLANLFVDETEFTMTTNLLDKNGVDISGTAVIITNCRIYTYKEITGAADDIIGEEISGSGLDWDLSGILPTPSSPYAEGNYSAYDFQNIGTVPISNGYTLYAENNCIILYRTTMPISVSTINYATGAITLLSDTSGAGQTFTKKYNSINGKYILVNYNLDSVKIYKDSVLLQNISVFTTVYSLSISPNGQYIVFIDSGNLKIYKGVVI